MYLLFWYIKIYYTLFMYFCQYHFLKTPLFKTKKEDDHKGHLLTKVIVIIYLL
jgi:hypothetical protein